VPGPPATIAAIAAAPELTPLEARASVEQRASLARGNPWHRPYRRDIDLLTADMMKLRASARPTP
jgi:hypothetical protein